LIAAKAKAKQKTSTGGANPQLKQNSAKAEKTETREELARMAGISHDTLDRTSYIRKYGTEEQIERAQTADDPRIEQRTTGLSAVLFAVRDTSNDIIF